MPGLTTLPPFPPSLQETELTTLPLSDLLSNDPATASKLFAICRTQGFFYLDLTTHPTGQILLEDAAALQRLSEAAFQLPPTTKRAVSQSTTGSIFGWKPAGSVAAADPFSRSDRGEFWNISKDDVLGNAGALGVPYPDAIAAHRAVFERFMRAAHTVGLEVLDSLAAKLGISPADMRARHRIDRLAGDHVRLTWGPADEHGARLPEREEDVRITTYAHTDFGSVTLLFNWLGGLQIENAQGRWEWVRPAEGCAIVNLGDAMVEFSGGRLASGRHRVVCAPGQQALCERYSVVYFVRPEDEVLMEDLTPEGRGGGKHVLTGRQDAHEAERVWTAKEWIRHRVLGMGNMINKSE